MSDNARSIVLVFDESHTRIQAVSELLLLSCVPRPVFTRPEDLLLTKDNYVRYRDKVIGQLNRMLILSRDIASQVHAKHIHWKPFCQRIQEQTAGVVHLSELSAHIAYLIAVNTQGSEPATSGPVASLHPLTQADLDMKFSCTRLKRSRVTDLQPHLLVDLCSTLSKSLTTMTDICRQAADKISEPNDQDQFKLCVKAITSTTGCLVSSIKCFKHKPSEAHFRRVLAFCEPVISTSAAVLSFAAEGSFMGLPATLSSQALELYKTILGLSMSMASANIQICRAVRDLVYSSSTKRQLDRMSLCVESITRSSGQLRDLLLSYEFVPKMNTAGSSTADLDVHTIHRVLDVTKREREHKSSTDSNQSPRTSVEKDIETTSRKTQSPSRTENVDTNRLETDYLPNRPETDYLPDQCSVVSSNSRPTSLIEGGHLLASFETTVDTEDFKSSPSEHYLSSPMSTSTTSLSSTISFDVDQEFPDGPTLEEFERKGALFTLDN